MTESRPHKQQSEKTILRKELIRVWGMLTAILELWQHNVEVLKEDMKKISAELALMTEKYHATEAKLKTALGKLAAYENYNNPSSKDPVTAKKRGKFRRDTRNAGYDDSSSATDEGESKKSGKKGGQPGSKGVSLDMKPDRSLDKTFDDPMCVVCGRTDTIKLKTIYKRHYMGSRENSVGGIFHGFVEVAWLRNQNLRVWQSLDSPNTAVWRRMPQSRGSKVVAASLPFSYTVMATRCRRVVGRK